MSITPPIPAITDTRRFLQMLDEIHLVSIDPDGASPPVGYHFAQDLEGALAWAQERNQRGLNVYWTVNRVRPGVHKKPRKEDMLAARYVHVDIDPTGTDWDRNVSLQTLAAAPAPPTLIVWSGNGWQAFWRLVQDEPDVAAIESLNRGLVKQFGGDKSCCNIDRLMRVPGLTNYPNAKKRKSGRVPSPAFTYQDDNGISYDRIMLVTHAGGCDDGENGAQKAVPNAVRGALAYETSDDVELAEDDPLRRLIERPDGSDRSADVLKCAGALKRANFTDVAIRGILLNPHNAISAHCLEQENPGRAADRAIAKVGAVKLDEPWPDPLPLPGTLPPVPAFDSMMLPSELTAYVVDIAERMSCPVDFVAIPAMVAAGALIGRRVGIRPQARTDWTEAANLWGAIVGPPGALKSPAVREALGPIRRLEHAAAETYKVDLAAFRLGEKLHKLALEDATQKAKSLLKKADGSAESRSSALAEIEKAGVCDPPREIRFLTNDATAEKLGEICEANPMGILVHRDELLTMFADLEREEKATARGFYLSGWAGLDGYTFDRIMRGTTRIEAVNISVLGTTQPNRLANYVRKSLQKHDDGMVQRIQLLTWPDFGGVWHNADRYPDTDAKKMAYACYERLAGITGLGLGAEVDPFGGIGAVPFLRFAPDALELFAQWRFGLEQKVRGDDLAPALAAHLSKYRGLVPRLALICHLAGGGVGAVTLDATLQALAWAQYLETHAERVYASIALDNADAARSIWRHVVRGDLSDGFTERDIKQRNWSGLDNERTAGGLKTLLDADWLRAEALTTGGRSTTVYWINPKAQRA